MILDPLSSVATDLLGEAVSAAKGVKLEGRAVKAAARELAWRGFGIVNRSGSRFVALPAGRFVAGASDREAAGGAS